MPELILACAWLVFWVAVVGVLLVWFVRPARDFVDTIIRQMKVGAKFKVGGMEWEGVPTVLRNGTLDTLSGQAHVESATDLDQKQRSDEYGSAKGLMLSHSFAPNPDKQGYYSIDVFVVAHGKLDKAGDKVRLQGALNDLRAVEYYFGPRFGGNAKGEFGAKYVVTNSVGGFRLRTEAFGPMLCVATLRFHDDSKNVQSRYVDIPIGTPAT